MTRKVFAKLMALFVLLLLFETAAMEVILRRMMEHSAGETLHRLGREAIWAGLIALLVALPLAAWAASRIAMRLQRVVPICASHCAGGSERAPGTRPRG